MADVYVSRRGRKTSTAPTITIGSEAIFISATAYELLGSPEFVLLAVSEREQGPKFCVRSALQSEHGALRVRIMRQRGHPYYNVAARGFKAWVGLGKNEYSGVRWPVETDLSDDWFYFGPPVIPPVVP